MEETLPSEGPAFGIVNAETVMEGIQTCQVSLEESRLRLMPLVKILDGDADDDLPPNGRSNGGSNAHPQLHHEAFTDGKIVHQFIESVEPVFGSIEMLIVRLADSGLVPLDHSNELKQNNSQGENNVYLLMASNCISKSSQFIGRHCLVLLEAESLEKPGPLDDHSTGGEEEFRIQPCIARLAELAARAIHAQTTLETLQNQDVDENDEETITPLTIVEAYSQYQRRCLRTRSKPAISSIAELRRVASIQNCYVSDLLEAEKRRQHFEVGLYEDDNEGGDGNGSRGQPHAQAITVVLGEASSLIQPLAAWRDAISQQSENDDVSSLLQQLCQESIKVLDNEAQTLAFTVGSWFGPDQRGVATLDHDNTGKDATKSDLLSIETSLEEMAFLCQVVSRYCLFSEQMLAREGVKDEMMNSDLILQNLLTEQSLHYSTLETRLATLQFNQALSLGSPQLIELGRPSLKVPSIVEDAHFICMRAIERASGTRSERAVWTVGHWVCEVWGVDQSGGMRGGEGGVKGVYSALVLGVGCAGEASGENENNDLTTKSRDKTSSAPSKVVDNAFAAALLEASGEGGDERKQKGSSNAVYGAKSAPASGGLTSFFGRGGNQQNLQSRIDAELCALNGISAAATACSALSGLFADMVEEKTQEELTNAGGMLTFARDELASHSCSYHNFLQQRIRALVTDLCGGDDIFDCDGQLCLQNLRLFVEKEIYNLDSSSFRSLEGEDRLEAELIGPVRRSQIFEEVGKDKCDSAVVLQMAEEMSWKSAEIILQVLFQGTTEFNEWGAMLLSKEVRMLQDVYCGLVLESLGPCSTKTATTGASSVSTATVLTKFERVNQAVSILQLEKPSDWNAFAYAVGQCDDTNLTPDEIRKVMGLRVDFSDEAIKNALK